MVCSCYGIFKNMFKTRSFSSMKHGNNDLRFGFHAADCSEPIEGLFEKAVCHNIG